MARDRIYTKQRRERSSMTVGMICYLMFGPIVWALHFGVLYGVHSMACAHYAGNVQEIVSTIHIVIGSATAVAVTVMVIAVVRPSWVRRVLNAGTWPDRQQKAYDRIMIGLTLLSLFAVIGAGASAIFVPACGSWR